jgi:predicted nucleic acid-binding Zn ribbon protein
MYCRKCGEELLGDSKFCSHCGTALERNSEKQVIKIAVWVLSGVLLAAAFGGFLYYAYGHTVGQKNADENNNGTGQKANSGTGEAIVHEEPKLTPGETASKANPSATAAAPAAPDDGDIPDYLRGVPRDRWAAIEQARRDASPGLSRW